MNKKIAIAYGDGIGPEIMDAVMHILQKSKAKLEFDVISIGEPLYKRGIITGISNESLKKVQEHKVLLKAPVTTPQGGGFKSVNVTFRKAFGLYVNLRPVIAYHPYIKTYHPNMDLVVIRENEEGLYAGIEYCVSTNTSMSLKLITRDGCAKIIKYAFEYARSHGRKKVTAISKDNIMKISDGTFHAIFNDIASDYSEIEANHMIVDIGAARLATNPEDFDVIVTQNLYGDILSDIAADVSGSVGLAGSANIGKNYGMFEAIHGSAPDIAGAGIANPSGLLHGSIMMLRHIGQDQIAENINAAWLKTIEDGIHTADIYSDNSTQKVNTMDFARAVVSNLKNKEIGNKTSSFDASITLPEQSVNKKIVGIDIYIESTNIDSVIADLSNDEIVLDNISSRGIKIWPYIGLDIEVSDVLRLRYMKEGITFDEILALQSRIIACNYQIVSTYTLCTYDGIAGFTRAQGE